MACTISDNTARAAANPRWVVMTQLHLLVPPVRHMSQDEACLEAFQQELDYIHRMLLYFGTAPSELEDLAQNVFLALRRSWHQYDPTRPLRPYLFGIAFRIAASHSRKRRREIAFGIIDVDDAAPDPDEALQKKQARALVLAALERIPIPRRAVLVLRDLEDVPVEQIASAFAIPRFTAYSRLRKARQEFETALRRLRKQADFR